VEKVMRITVLGAVTLIVVVAAVIFLLKRLSEGTKQNPE